MLTVGSQLEAEVFITSVYYHVYYQQMTIKKTLKMNLPVSFANASFTITLNPRLNFSF